MTIAPNPPILKQYKPNDLNLKVLMDEHITFVKMGFGYSLMVRIKPGFVTDGASVPKERLWDDKDRAKIEDFIKCKYSANPPREVIEDFIKKLIGTPWDMPRLLAAIVHDALYSLHWWFRWLCDLVYIHILSENGYDAIRGEIEHFCIRLVGWRNWNAVSKEEIRKTKELVSMAFVRTKKVAKIREQLIVGEM